MDMYEPTPTLPNVIFGQLFIWIGYNNESSDAF